MDTQETQFPRQVSGGKRNSMRIFMRLLGVVVVITIIACVWAWRSVYAPLEKPGSAFEQEFIVEQGASVRTIAQQLEGAELIRSSLWFEVYARYTDAASKLQAGTYTLTAMQSTAEITEVLFKGGVSGETVRVTIIEGLRSDKIYDELAAAGLQFTEAEWNTALEDITIQIDPLYLDGAPSAELFTWEGFLFPDTYEFAGEATAKQVVQKMVSTFERKVGAAVPTITAGAASQDLSVYELVILASIIEREVIDIDEREIAAGIFLQRIKDTYPLQSDATVEYVTRTERVETSFEETRTESLWNTYTNTGLPPTPISSPAISAIEAVVNAQFTDYYFFLTTPEGDAIFTKTFEQHLVQKDKYYPN